MVAFLLVAALDACKIPGAISSASWRPAQARASATSFSGGFVSLPPSIAPVLLKLDIVKALEIGVIAIVFTFFFVDVFDNTGTLVGVAHKAGLVKPDGTLPRAQRALTADSAAAMAGALLGTSTTTSYIESAAGVNAGGRTGLGAVAIRGATAARLAPGGAIPAFATAPALSTWPA